MSLSALAAALVLLAGVSPPASPGAPAAASQGSSAPLSCDKADALHATGEDKAARKAYVAVLEAEPASVCARRGLKGLNAGNPHPARADCARGNAYLSVDRDGDAIKAFEAALKANPYSPCAKRGLDEAGPSEFERSAKNFESSVKAVVDRLPALLDVAGLALLALFLFTMLGYVKGARILVRHAPFVGKWIGPRMSIEKFEDEAIEGKPGAPIAARIKERLHRMREEAVAADGGSYGIDASLPREDFADLVSESGSLKNSLEKASDVSDQTKIVAAVLNLVYALLPIQRISVVATMAPPAGTGAAATLIIEENGRLKAATTVQGAAPAAGDPKAADYDRLADPAAVWVQHEVTRILAKETEDADAAKAYALVREGLDFQLAEEWSKARACYLKAIGLNRRNWAAYVNLAVADAWLEEDFDTSIEMLSLGFSEVKKAASG